MGLGSLEPNVNEYLTLAERVARGYDFDLDEVVEALTETRDLLQLKEIEGGQINLGQDGVIGPDLLKALRFKHNLEINGEIVAKDIIELFQEHQSDFHLADGQENPTGYLAASRYLEDAALWAERMSGLSSRHHALWVTLSTKKPSSEISIHEGRFFQVTCDAKTDSWTGRCFTKPQSSAHSQASANALARKSGWYVSDEKDLCPQHLPEGFVPEVSHDPAPTLMPGVSTFTPGGFSIDMKGALDGELVIVEAEAGILPPPTPPEKKE